MYLQYINMTVVFGSGARVTRYISTVAYVNMTLKSAIKGKLSLIVVCSQVR